MFVNKHYLYLAYNSKSKQCYNEKTSVYFFNEQTKILVDFHISISVHCVKSVQIQSYFWSIFSCIGQISIFSPNTGKYRPEITPYLDTFHAVVPSTIFTKRSIEDTWQNPIFDTSGLLYGQKKNALKINYSFKVNNKDTRTTLLLSL